jgi:hypothetical protein
MTAKKKLITRMAFGAGMVLAVGLALIGVSFLFMHADHQRWEHEREREREQIVERSRKYLGELATRITKLPVDPTLVGEVESRYFEERARGSMKVWAMGTGGEFLFGVPKESFSRLNAVYDREVTPRLKEGVFFDRQSFLLGHMDGGAELVLSGDLTGPEGVLEKLRRQADSSDGTFVLSSPLKTAEGGALGSLYLKRKAADRDWYREDERLRVMGILGGVAAALSFVFLWILLPTWVYVDARERGVRRAPLFAFLTTISSFIGLIVYLIARPEDLKTLACPGCGREVNGGAFCPHCGRDLSAAFCGTCRYPLKPDWGFCPSCRTETRSVSVAPAEAEPAR